MTTPNFDAALASAAFDKLRARLAAVPPAALQPARPDLRPLLATAFAAAQAAAEPELQARLARLPAEELSPETAQLLGDAAWALWHARGELDKALQPPADPQLPAELVEGSGQLRERMLRVLRYWFEDDAELGKPLAALARKKPAPGELPADLRRLAALYRERQEALKADARHYKAEDAAEADRLAGEISAQLSAFGAEGIRSWTEQLARAQALLVELYGELRAAALYLLRKDASAGERFPDLLSLPAPRGRPRKSAGAPISEPPPVRAVESAPLVEAPAALAAAAAPAAPPAAAAKANGVVAG
jgi:hypothetical protein